MSALSVVSNLVPKPTVLRHDTSVVPYVILLLSQAPYSKDFEDYRDQFSVEEVSRYESDQYHITYKITNNTDYKWNRITYEIQAKKGDKLISTKYDSEYAWVVLPHNSALVTARLPYLKEADDWEFSIVEIRSDRF
ncbi:MAG: hypothetical protein R3C11_11965 [Planctomycetaceae bacterium]